MKSFQGVFSSTKILVENFAAKMLQEECLKCFLWPYGNEAGCGNDVKK